MRNNEYFQRMKMEKREVKMEGSYRLMEDKNAPG